MSYAASVYLDNHEQELIKSYIPTLYIIDILHRVLKINKNTSDETIDHIVNNLVAEGMTDREFAVIFSICYYLTNKNKKYLIMKSGNDLDYALDHDGAGFVFLLEDRVDAPESFIKPITDQLINYVKEKQCAITTPELNILRRLTAVLFEPGYRGFDCTKLFDKLK